MDSSPSFLNHFVFCITDSLYKLFVSLSIRATAAPASNDTYVFHLHLHNCKSFCSSLHPYYQGNRSHSSKGLGLGLSIAHRIVELCDGSIEVTSALDQGSYIYASYY